jgi:hypothetical protein
LEWQLAQLFCEGANAHQVSKKLHVAYGTVRKHFARWDGFLRNSGYPAGRTLVSIRDEKNPVPERWRSAGLDLIFRVVIRPAIPKLTDDSEI